MTGKTIMRKQIDSFNQPAITDIIEGVPTSVINKYGGRC